jgi:hypothetical protein
VSSLNDNARILNVRDGGDFAGALHSKSRATGIFDDFSKIDNDLMIWSQPIFARAAKRHRQEGSSNLTLSARHGNA